jgi:hypothetical protein
MTLAIWHELGGIVAAWVTALIFARTPDRDRPLAYPDQPTLWCGIDPENPGGFRHALKSPLFWSLFVGFYGLLVGALLWRLPMAAAGPLGFAIAAGVTGLGSRRLLRHGAGAMGFVPRLRSSPKISDRPHVLLIGGSLNQTIQMHRVAEQLRDCEVFFSPYFDDRSHVQLIRKLGLVEMSILSGRRRKACLTYLRDQGLRVDLYGEQHRYDLYLSSNDQLVPSSLRRTPSVIFQEGIHEPATWRTAVWRWTRLLPRSLAGTSVFGQSYRYDRLCAASEGYRQRFMDAGVDPSKIVVTGMPNFDDFARLLEAPFPHRDYVLVCTSDARETFVPEDRARLLDQVARARGGRKLLCKLHPNENFARAEQEIRTRFPDAIIYTDGSAEVMVAHAAVLFTEWSSLTFVGVALEKEVFTNHSLDEVRALMPIQNGRASEEIAKVCREVLEARSIEIRFSRKPGERSLEVQSWNPQRRGSQRADQVS